MKRFLSILLAIAMIAALMPMNIFAADMSAFKDMTGDEYYAESAEKLAGLRIFTGYEDGTFGADKQISRAEMAAVAEYGIITINGRGNRESEINGPVTNNGVINLASGKLMLRNTGFISHNYGTISVASGSTLCLPGTKLINGGTINGAGAIECTS